MTDLAEFVVVGVPSHPAASPDQQALLDWAATHPTGRTEAPKSRGRYRLPDPDTGKTTSWTRATTLASTIDDSEGLTVWRNRLLVAGMTAPGLIDQAAAATAAGDKATLGQIAGRALHHAGEKLAADVGTALHTATEHADLGSGERPPPPWSGHVDTYTATLAAHGIATRPEWVERVAINPAAGCAGTIDRIVTGPWGDLARVADLKTGSSSAERIGYAAQLAIYARATHLLALDGQDWEPMPDIDLDTALIIHLPAAGGPCEIIEVDIARGWELVATCLEVRTARRTKDLFATLAPPPADPSRVEWMRERIRAVVACDDPRGRDALASHWPTGVAKAAGEWTATDLHRLDALLHAVEILDAVGFAPPDPTAPKPTPEPLPDGPPDLPPAASCATPADATVLTDLAATVDTLTVDQKRLAAWWERQGRTAGRRWTLGTDPGARIAAVNAAALACATHLDEPATRCALAAATGWDLHPTWPTGALLGCLDQHQADTVRTYAVRIGADDTGTVADLGERLTAHFSDPNHTNQEQPQ